MKNIKEVSQKRPSRVLRGRSKHVFGAEGKESRYAVYL
jgi:hypothetical protein